MTNEQDPLKKLFVSESQSVNRQELADLLFPYLSIHIEEGTFDFSSRFSELPNVEKMLVILAAVKARSMVVKDAADGISPSEIIAMEVMPIGSVKGTLKKLADARDIKVHAGKYALPNYKISQVVARLKNLES